MDAHERELLDRYSAELERIERDREKLADEYNEGVAAAHSEYERRMNELETQFRSQMVGLRERADRYMQVIGGIRALAGMDDESLFDSLGEQATFVLEGLSTRDAALHVLAENHQRAFRVPELVKAMRKIGWATDSERPMALVRTTLQRLVGDGLVERVDRGTYQYVIWGVDEGDDDDSPE